MNITYVRFSPTANPELLPQLIRCYQDVFSTSPWFEWKQCERDNLKWGKEQASEIPNLQCPTCGDALTDFWPSDVVEHDIRKELILPNATCWLALAEGKVIGFCWGYSLTLAELEVKLGATCAAAFHASFNGTPRVAYQDEIGVIAPFRGRHIASKLFQLRLQDFLAQGLTVGTVRTKTLPPSVTYLWFNRLGYQTIANYNDADGRVVMAMDMRALFK